MLRLILLGFMCMQLQAQIPSRIEEHSDTSHSSGGTIVCFNEMLSRLIEKYGYKNLVEIGVKEGDRAEYLLSQTDIEVYIGIDLYSYSESSYFSGQKELDDLYYSVKTHRLLPFLHRSYLIRWPSTEAAHFFEDESIDCLVVDTPHSRALLKNLHAWFPKLKREGVVIGGHYSRREIASVVHTFFSKYNLYPTLFITSQTGERGWIVRK